MTNFVLLGASGYIAPRHMDAIHALGHNLVAAYDPSDTASVLDSYFPECAFFTSFDKLNAFLKCNPEKIDFVSIASPNFIHFEQIQWALKIGADVICEKPLVLTAAELDALEKTERETGKRTYTVLQLRVHETVKAVREKIALVSNKRYQVELEYITARGPWYQNSWKGDVKKSGGLSTNIGIHLFDMLLWIFGDVKEYGIEERSPYHEKGQMQLERGNVNWLLSIDRERLPESVKAAGKSTHRNITIDGAAFEFSEGFTELHRTVYRDILSGAGYGIRDASPAIALAEKLRAR